MIQTQQESIDTLKQMLSRLLKDKKKPKGKTPSKNSKGKVKEGESSSANTESKEYSNSEPPKSSSEEDLGEQSVQEDEQIEATPRGPHKLRWSPRCEGSPTLPSRVGHDSLPPQVQGIDPFILSMVKGR